MPGGNTKAGPLSRCYWEHAPQGEPRDLEPLLEALCARARVELPELELRELELVAHLAARSTPGTPPEQTLPALHAGDLLLCSACAHGDARAMAFLAERLDREVPLAVRRLDASHAFADEVLQRLRVRLLVGEAGGAPAIADYRGRGPLRSWLRSAALRTGLTLRAESLPGDSAQSYQDARSPDTELEYLKAHYGEQVERSLREELAALLPRTRTMLRLHYAERLTADQLGAIYHVSRTTAARWLARHRRVLMEGTRRRLHEVLGLHDAELDSMLRMVMSRLHISIEKALAPPK